MQNKCANTATRQGLRHPNRRKRPGQQSSSVLAATDHQSCTSTEAAEGRLPAAAGADEAAAAPPPAAGEAATPLAAPPPCGGGVLSALANTNTARRCEMRTQILIAAVLLEIPTVPSSAEVER